MFIRRFYLYIFLAALALAGAVAFVYLRGMPVSRSAVLQRRLITVRFTYPNTASSVLPLLADKFETYDRRGLLVKSAISTTGSAAIKALENGETDFAVAYSTPVVRSVLEGKQLVVLSELHASSQNTALVFRRSVGLNGPGDLAGKKIGLIPSTNAEFFLEMLIRAHNLRSDQIQAVRRDTPAELSQALTNSQLDAAVLWEPDVSRFAKNRPVYGRYFLPFFADVSMLVTTREYANKHPKVILAMVKALADAETAFLAEPTRYRQAVQNLLTKEFDAPNPHNLNAISVRMGLSHLLISLLREEIVWHYRVRYGFEREIPVKLQDFIDPVAVSRVKPLWVVPL